MCCAIFAGSGCCSLRPHFLWQPSKRRIACGGSVEMANATSSTHNNTVTKYPHNDSISILVFIFETNCSSREAASSCCPQQQQHLPSSSGDRRAAQFIHCKLPSICSACSIRHKSCYHTRSWSSEGSSAAAVPRCTTCFSAEKATRGTGPRKSMASWPSCKSIVFFVFIFHLTIEEID